MDLPLPGIKIQIVYDQKLQEITGVESEEAFVSAGLNFVMMLRFIFSSYPEIEKKYLPGTLGLLLNDKPPTEFDVLSEGDEVKLTVTYKLNNSTECFQ